MELIFYKILTFYGACSLLFTLVWITVGWLTSQNRHEEDVWKR